VIGQLPDLLRQIHTLPGTPTTQEVGGIRVPAVEGVQIALHTPLLLGGGLAAGELVEVLIEQVLRRGRARTGGGHRREQLLPGFVDGRGHRVGTLEARTADFILLRQIRILASFVIRHGVNRFAGRRRTNWKRIRVIERLFERSTYLHRDCAVIAESSLQTG